MAFVYPIYPVPLGIQLGRVPVAKFSGEPNTGPFIGVRGAVFFSPSLFNAVPNNEIDLDNIQVVSRATDVYTAPVQENHQVFVWGPTALLAPKSITKKSGVIPLGSYVGVSAPKFYSAIGTMIQTIPPGPTTIFKVM